MPTRYSIQTLLDSGIQPFDDLDDETFAALTKGIAASKALAVPVVLTSDGVLIDGHQRLRAMRAEGRKFIDAHDVRVIDDATAENALEWAVRLNVQRRSMSFDEKGEVARQLQADRGWSQTKIAELFGVSQAAVSKWLKGKGETPDRPRKPRTKPTVKGGASVLNESTRYAAEVSDPRLYQWISDYVEDEDREIVIMRWEAVAKAATEIAEMVAASTPAPYDGEPF